MKTIRTNFFEEDVEARHHPTLPVICLADGSVIREHTQERCKSRTYGAIRQDGYMAVSLCNGRHYVHKLIAEAFIPKHDADMTVDHINRCKWDNRVSNLRFATLSEQAENREFVERRKLDIPVREKDDLAGYTRARRKYVREHGHGYGKLPVIDDDAHRKARGRQARYRARHPERLKEIHHNHYLKMRERYESR